MPKFTFVGVNASGYVEYGNVRFETGKPVTVEDSKENADLIRRLESNQEFVAGAPDAATKKEIAAAEAAQDDPFDHDGDGEPGGSKPKLSIKAK